MARKADGGMFVPEAEQPYKIPDNWRWVKLAYPTTIIMGQSPEGDATTNDNSFLPLIGGAADMGELYPNATRYTKQPTKISRADDVILCVRATLGRPIYSDGNYCLGRGVAAIRPVLGTNKFYRYLLICFEQYLIDMLPGQHLRKAAILYRAFTGELTEQWRKHNGISLDSLEKATLS